MRNKIKNFLFKKQKILLSSKNWRLINGMLKSGKANRNIGFIAKMIRKNVPNFSKKKKHKAITLKIKASGKCGSKFFKRLKKMLHRFNKKNPKKCLNKIRNFLNQHFKLSNKSWNKIRNSIKNGTFKTKKARRSLITKIKNNIHRKNIKRPHWTKKTPQTK